VAPPAVRFNDNPIEVSTIRAARVLGKLIEDWATDPSTRPDGATIEGDGRLIVFHVAVLRAILDGLPEADQLRPHELRIHPDVQEIELLLPRQDRFSIRLPDPRAIEHQKTVMARGHDPSVRLPKGQTLSPRPDGIWADLPDAPEDDADALAEVRLNTPDPLDVFLRPYLATYVCLQCT
jgi:hypothetical protein